EAEAAADQLDSSPHDVAEAAVAADAASADDAEDGHSDADSAEAEAAADPGTTEAPATSETEVVAAAVGATAAAPVVEQRGGALAWLGLLLALLAAGGAGYIYYELIYKDPFSDIADKYAPADAVETIDRVRQNVTRNTQTEEELAAQIVDLQAELERANATAAEQVQELSGSVSRTVSTVEGKLDEQRESLRATEKQLMASLNDVANRAPPTRAEWRVAEVEYLLRIANHRVLMERDAEGGLRLLEAADAILAELDDFGLYQVRAQLAEETLALKRVGQVDAQGMFLRLEAVKRELDGLPLEVPELLTSRPSSELGEEAGFFARVLDQFTPYFSYRSELKTRIEPLLSPDEITYLELNLRLMLEQAQLAALRAQQEIFEQSLDNAADWMTKFLDASDPKVEQIVREIRELRDSSVLRELPDISGSLRALQDTERGT
ncbi:MAG: uroporphyrinogen-III C-methyltransferase, partial [Pseudomonadota bacterium]